MADLRLSGFVARLARARLLRGLGDTLLLLVATREAAEREARGEHEHHEDERGQSEIAHRPLPASALAGPHRPPSDPAQNKSDGKYDKEIEPEIGKRHHSLSSTGLGTARSPWGR